MIVVVDGLATLVVRVAGVSHVSLGRFDSDAAKLDASSPLASAGQP